MSDELETVGKVADATAEVAKTGAKAIDAASDTGRFFNTVFGDLVVDGFGLLSDRLKFYRAERWILLGEKTRERLTAKGITNYRPVPPKIALPLIESATIEDDDDLHSLWADLLAAAMNPDEIEVGRRFVSVAKELSSQDRALIEYMWNARGLTVINTLRAMPIRGKSNLARRLRSRRNPSRQYSIGELVSNDFKKENAQHLIILGLLEPALQTVEIPVLNDPRRTDKIYGGSNAVTVEKTDSVHFTEFGFDFCNAVMPSPTPDE